MLLELLLLAVMHAKRYVLEVPQSDPSCETATYLEVSCIVTIQLLVFCLLILGVPMLSCCDYPLAFQFYILVGVHLIASLHLCEKIIVNIIGKAEKNVKNGRHKVIEVKMRWLLLQPFFSKAFKLM
jgi:hypothetical protein